MRKEKRDKEEELWNEEGTRFNSEAKKEKECWQYGPKRHFRFEFPVNVKQKGN